MITKKPETSLVLSATPEFIGRRIFLIRRQKVMLSTDLAELYQVEPRALTQAVKRNQERFPEDFMFNLTSEEAENLKSQSVISSWGGRRHTPYAFTELGVAMLSSVLKSERAVQMNIFIMRAFVKLRELLATNKELAVKIEELERAQKKQGSNIQDLNIAVNKLLMEKRKLKSAIGFQID